MLCHYALRDEWTDAIEGFEGLFDEVHIEESFGEEERLGALAFDML